MTFPALKSLISRETGVPPFQITLLHAADDSPVENMRQIRSHIDPESSNIELTLWTGEGDAKKEVAEIVSSEFMVGKRKQELKATFMERKLENEDEGEAVEKGKGK